MSTHQEVKYRGMEPVLNWAPTHAQPRPGLIEANSCVKRILAKTKNSRIAVLTCSAAEGIQCVDTTTIPPQPILSHPVNEIAHCGVDVTKPRLFTLIVGRKSGGQTNFFCHIFKCENKQQAARIVRAVATACTLAFKDYQGRPQQAAAPPAAMGQAPAAGGFDDPVQKHIRASMRKARAPAAQQRPPGSRPKPKLTDSWFRPSMSRGEVNTILRNSRIGDFLIRESQTRPGDYAISVQTGNQIWTGLIIRSAGGYQLGERGGVAFEDLTELVGFYSQNKFMNDTNGYPLTMRLPDDTEWGVDEPAAPPAGGGNINSGQSFRIADWRQSTRGGPRGGGGGGGGGGFAGREPTFEEIMNGEVGMPEEFDQAQTHAGADSSDEGESFAPADINPQSEQEAFELFMNQGGFDIDENGELVQLTDVADALEEIEDEEDAFDAANSAAVGGSDDPFGGPAAPATAASGFDDDFVASPAAAAETPATSTGASIMDVAKKIFEITPADDENCLGGGEVRPSLLLSGLDVNTLGQIWMEVDSERRGKIDFDQLCLILGLISQAQSGQEPDLATMDPDTTPAPDLPGL